MLSTSKNLGYYIQHKSKKTLKGGELKAHRLQDLRNYRAHRSFGFIHPRLRAKDASDPEKLTGTHKKKNFQQKTQLS